jgi:hypothetical protein
VSLFLSLSTSVSVRVSVPVPVPVSSAERSKGAARDKISEMRAAHGGAVREAYADGLRGWVTGSLLHPGLPVVGKGGWYSLLLPDHGEDTGSPEGEDNHPRMELMAAVTSVRLAKKTWEALKIPLVGTRYFTDLLSVLGMLRTESGKFNEFVGARVSEVKVNSNIEDEWRWLEGNFNPADLGTRSKATPKDMIPGSEYQKGKPWMTEPENTWPCKKSFSPALAEEFRKDMLEGACCVVKEVRSDGEQEDDFPEVKKGGLERLIRVYGFVMAAVHKWRKKQGAAGPVLINFTQKGGRGIGYPSAECLRSAELFLLE